MRLWARAATVATVMWACLFGYNSYEPFRSEIENVHYRQDENEKEKKLCLESWNKGGDLKRFAEILCPPPVHEWKDDAYWEEQVRRIYFATAWIFIWPVAAIWGFAAMMQWLIGGILKVF